MVNVDPPVVPELAGLIDEIEITLKVNKLNPSPIVVRRETDTTKSI
jgi:hypothetical protein